MNFELINIIEKPNHDGTNENDPVLETLDPIIIGNGVEKHESADNLPSYHKQVNIEEHSYTIDVYTHVEKNLIRYANLNFSAQGINKHGQQKITNAGLSVFYKLASEMRDVVTTVNKDFFIDVVDFSAINSKIDYKTATNITHFIDKLIIENPTKFNGFDWTDEKRKIMINDQEVYLIDLRDSNTTKQTKTIPLVEFVKEPSFLNSMFIEKLLNHLGFSDEKTLKKINMDGGRQRMNLYERVAKRAFPEYEFERLSEITGRIYISPKELVKEKGG